MSVSDDWLEVQREKELIFTQMTLAQKNWSLFSFENKFDQTFHKPKDVLFVPILRPISHHFVNKVNQRDKNLVNSGQRESATNARKPVVCDRSASASNRDSTSTPAWCLRETSPCLQDNVWTLDVTFLTTVNAQFSILHPFPIKTIFDFSLEMPLTTVDLWSFGQWKHCGGLL